MKPQVILDPPGHRVLLHSCCAPCSGAVLECLLSNGIRPRVFFSNSNIAPVDEYLKRRDELVRYCESLGVEWKEDVYEHENWVREVACGRESAPERGPRCLECFRFRLRRAALYAASEGFDTLATTLASSRWKSLEQVNLAGAAAVEGTGVLWWPRDWRKGGLQPRRSEIIREQQFYNQTWCGCEYSNNQ